MMGSRLWPPASALAAPLPAASRATASATVVGEAYLKAGSFIVSSVPSPCPAILCRADSTQSIGARPGLDDDVAPLRGFLLHEDSGFVRRSADRLGAQLRNAGAKLRHGY